MSRIRRISPSTQPRAFLLRQTAAAALVLTVATPLAMAQSGETSATLPTVTVSGQASGATAPYAGGQVSSGGRVGFLGDKDFMETPFSTISYTEKYVADRQAKDITEVIAATDPSVFSNGVSGAWSENYSIRGFASGTSDMTFGGLAGMAPYYRTSPEMFERVEVLKGPSALLNGMPPGGSVGGAINLVPKRAGDTPLTRFTTTYLSDAQFGGHLDMGRRFGAQKEFGLRFNGVYRDGAGPVDNQDKKLQMGALGLDWRSQRARLSADFYSADDHINGQTRGVSLAPGVAIPRPPSGDTLINPDWAYVDSKDKGAILRGEIDLTDRITAYGAFGSARTNYQYNGAISAQVLNAAGDYRTTMGQLAFDVDKKSAEVGLKGRLQTAGIKHQWALNATRYEHDQRDYGRRTVPGADWTTNLYHPVWGAAPAFIAPPVSHTALELTSFGLVDTMSFAQDRVQLTLGLRRQQVKSDTYSTATGLLTTRYDQGETTPAAALLVKASDRIALYANYIEGLSQGQKAPITSANPDDIFAPYKTRQKETGVKIDMGDFTHTFSVYEISKPASYTDPVTNIFSFGGEQRNRGLEWSFFGAATRSLRLMGGVAYVDPKVTRTTTANAQGKMATGVAKLQGKLGVEWDVPGATGLTLTGNATSVSKQYISADNGLWVGGRTTYDLGARYATRLANRSVTFRAGITNVTNKAYWGMPLLSSLALGAPRTFQLSASVDL
ncbi:TonB-dependent siderophore receptor [Pantoea sp. 18069]|uniref:TonB-dependent receptor n=1 Tax=Pantoea sp. 18069 TaxID=2681415 RepID=UPI001359C43E|nr:TonB-dependent siderophore receptor [Pantoea sp. 18069]